MRIVKAGGWAFIGLSAALLQGLVVYWLGAFDGAFIGQTGLACILAPIGVEVIVLIASARHLDELHARAVANPHSLLGQSLRRDLGNAPPPPSTRDAWGGKFEDMRQAAAKMAKDR